MLYVKGKGNVRIAVNDLNPSGKEAVLFIHGWPLSSKIFEYQQNFLVEQGYRVVSVDLRGFGQSDVSTFGYGYSTMAADIHNVVCALCLSSFTLVGFSMGGAVALRYMKLCRGAGVRRLVLLAAAAPRFTCTSNFPYGIPREEVDSLIEAAKTDRAKMCYDFSKNLFFRRHSKEIIEWFAEIALSSSSTGTIESACSLRGEDGRDDLLYVGVPTGIFHGRQDKIVPFDLAQYQHKIIRRSELFAFDDCGHGIIYDDLESFNDTFLNYIRSC